MHPLVVLPTALLTLGLLAASATALAQDPPPGCTPRYPPAETMAAMFDMAAVTSQRLDAQEGVDVAIAARGGQDLSKYGLRHSHLAILLRDDNHQWQVYHLLNRCQGNTSRLYREGLVNLLGESSVSSNLRVGIPTPEVAAALRQLLAGDAPTAHALHQPRYSMLAWPGGDDYQNSNQWVLEMLAAAIAHSRDGQLLDARSKTRHWLKDNGYLPSRLHIGLGKRLGARFFVDNVAVTDHPASERISGNYSVVTVESVFNFLHDQQVLQQELSIPHRQLPSPAQGTTP